MNATQYYTYLANLGPNGTFCGNESKCLLNVLREHFVMFCILARTILNIFQPLTLMMFSPSSCRFSINGRCKTHASSSRKCIVFNSNIWNHFPNED